MCIISNVGKTYIVLGADYNFIILIKMAALTMITFTMIAIEK